MKISSLVFLMISLLSLAAYPQISGPNFEGAGTLKPGQFEFAANNSSEYSINLGKTEKYFHSFGTYIRLGVKKQIDLKLAYNRLSVGRYNDGLNLIQISPKFSSKNGKFALRLPFGVLFEKYEYHGTSEYETFFLISARVFYTPVSKRIFELSIIPMSEIYFHKAGGSTTSYGLNLGLGFSNNFDIWSIRPEAGALFMCEFNWGLGISGTFTIGGRDN